jgi:hypothetical protein
MGVRTETIYTCDRCSTELRNPKAPLGWRFVTLRVNPGDMASSDKPITLCPTCVDVVNAALKPDAGVR